MTPADPTAPKPENHLRTVWALAWPAVALNSLQVVNMLLDTAFVGRLGRASLTAVGGSTNVMFLMFSVAMAVGTSSTALVSRSFGANKKQRLNAANRQCLSVAWLAGLLSMLVALGLAPIAANLLLPPDAKEAIVLMVRYLTAYAFGLPAIAFIQALAGSLRGIGDTKSPMVVSGVQILLHITLNYTLIFPPRTLQVGAWVVRVPGADMGLVGAACALSISAWVAAAIYLLWTLRTPLDRAWLPVWPRRRWTHRIVAIGAPAALMSVVRVASLWMFTYALKLVPNGDAAIGAMSAGFRIESIMFMPAFGLSVAAGALVGQSLGMRRPDRAERLAWVASHSAGVVIGVMSVFVFLGAPFIAGALVPKDHVTAGIIADFLRYICLTEVLFGYAMVLIGAMQGAGDTVRPMWIAIIAMWGLRVPMAFFFALGLRMGASGAWLAMSLTQAVQGVLTIVLFRRGDWKTVRL